FEVFNSLARRGLGIVNASGAQCVVGLAHARGGSQQSVPELTVELDAALVVSARGLIIAHEGEVQGAGQPEWWLDRRSRVLGEQLVARAHPVGGIDRAPGLKKRSVTDSDRSEATVAGRPSVVGRATIGSTADLRAPEPALEGCSDVPGFGQRSLVTKLFQLGDPLLHGGQSCSGPGGLTRESFGVDSPDLCAQLQDPLPRGASCIAHFGIRGLRALELTRVVQR